MEKFSHLTKQVAKSLEQNQTLYMQQLKHQLQSTTKYFE